MARKIMHLFDDSGKFSIEMEKLEKHFKSMFGQYNDSVRKLCPLKTPENDITITVDEVDEAINAIVVFAVHTELPRYLPSAPRLTNAAIQRGEGNTTAIRQMAPQHFRRTRRISAFKVPIWKIRQREALPHCCSSRHCIYVALTS